MPSFKVILHLSLFIMTLFTSLTADNIKTIKMCNNPNWAPIEFAKDSNMSNMMGIAIDTIRVLEKDLNFKVKNIPTKSWTQSQLFLSEGKCDILPAAIATKKRKAYALFTKPYLSYSLAIITKNDKPFVRGIEDILDKTIARKKGSGLIQKLKNLYPEINIVETVDYLEALQRVSSGEIYATIATLPVASYFINQFALTNLHISGYTEMKYNLSIAVRKDNPELLKLLDKGLENVSQKQHREIYERWANRTITETFNYEYLIYFVLFVFAITFLILYKQNLLKKSNKDLEKKVKEKMEENLIQHQLIQEQAKLAAMGEMIGAIAHQWRQPLNALGLSIQNLEYDYHGGQIDEVFIKNYVRKNKITIKFMSQTIDDFRSFFKVDKVKETFSIKEAIDSTLSMQSVYLEKDNISYTLEGDDFRVYGLRSELQQVILSLVSNARDALVKNRVDGRRIKITLEDKAVMFADNAKGIPAHILDKIFEAYFTTKKDGAGTGIGLYMSKMIIEDNMNASISASNQKDGALFLLDFKEPSK